MHFDGVCLPHMKTVVLIIIKQYKSLATLGQTAPLA